MTQVTLNFLIEQLQSFLPQDARDNLARQFDFIAVWGAPGASVERQARGGRFLADLVDAVAIDLGAEQKMEMTRQMLHFFEGLAEKGDLFSMRYTAFAYARGEAKMAVVYHENGWSLHAQPDYDSALHWCRRAAAAGDHIAAQSLPGLEDDARRAVPQTPPSRPAPPPTPPGP